MTGVFGTGQRIRLSDDDEDRPDHWCGDHWDHWDQCDIRFPWVSWRSSVRSSNKISRPARPGPGWLGLVVDLATSIKASHVLSLTNVLVTPHLGTLTATPQLPEFRVQTNKQSKITTRSFWLFFFSKWDETTFTLNFLLVKNKYKIFKIIGDYLLQR